MMYYKMTEERYRKVMEKYGYIPTHILNYVPKPRKKKIKKVKIKNVRVKPKPKKEEKKLSKAKKRWRD